MGGLINWVELRKSAFLLAHRFDACSALFWDNRAASFNQNTENMKNLTQLQLKKLNLLPQHTLLDVGAGNGRITIPVSKCVKYVTAVEQSEQMLNLLKINAQKEKINNISFINKSWDELSLLKDVFPHDIVIASFSVFMVDIENALLKMDAVAKSSVTIFVSASKWLDEELQKIIYGDVVQIWADYIYIYNILHDLGILANVEIDNFMSTKSYLSLDDAVKDFLNVHKVSSQKELKIREYLCKKLTEKDGKLWLNQNRKMATIWWTKNQ
ncbi:MAG: class I SAM-dependent methyltransferase [Crenarchaeota archaeon]|nr:class I SAM-dependent methyltransferase [Thermoproteota archaeon]